ncbi:MAG: hypothetical protein ACT6RD_00945 [Brevundimonas sp.]|uniref:hypothetical protein n=1 Tax=Brevundimonas sp. TaxID=1871086 RepID=UPI004034269A
MSGPFRVWLLQIPADGAEAWRDALSQACADAGWDFAVHNRHAPAPMPHPERSMLVVSWLHHIDAHPVTHYLVQAGAPGEAAGILAQEDETAQGELLRDVSLRYAVADFLTRLHTPFIPADAAVMNVPGLGDVHCSPNRPLRSTSHPEPALDIFERLPIPIGVQATWGPELFDYADPGADSRTGRLSLVGRRRLLFNGPHIHLPKGIWRFEGSFSIDPGGDADLLIEWGYGHDVQSLPVVIGQAGRYEVVLEQAWSDVMNADFRISLMTPLLEGTMTFHGGTVTRLPDAPAEAG